MPNHRVSNSSGVRWTDYDGKNAKKWSVLHEAAQLYAPQGAELGGDGSPSQRIDTVKKARTRENCKALVQLQ